MPVLSLDYQVHTGKKKEGSGACSGFLVSLSWSGFGVCWSALGSQMRRLQTVGLASCKGRSQSATNSTHSAFDFAPKDPDSVSCLVSLVFTTGAAAYLDSAGLCMIPVVELSR